MKLRHLINSVILTFASMIVAVACSRGSGREDSLADLRFESFDVDVSAHSAVADSLAAAGGEDWCSHAMALIAPEAVEEILRTESADGRLGEIAFPLVTDLGSWASAAWEVYCMTGSRSWLKDAYGILTAAMRVRYQAAASSMPPLLCGQPRSLADSTAFYPSWMLPMDRWQTMTVRGNADYARACHTASLMAAEQNLYAAGEHQLAFTKLREAINDRMWIPDAGRYGSCLYGQYYPILSRADDGLANVLCVLSGLASPEMAESALATADVAVGMPHEEILMAALAAAKVRNATMLVKAASAMSASHDHRLKPLLWTALVAKAFFGMAFSPDGISFTPFSPEESGGYKRLSGFKYRKAVLDITLHGTGDRVASFTIDSVSQASAFIPAAMEGHHRVDIVLSGNDLPRESSTGSAGASTLPVPQLDWASDGITARILNYDPKLHYVLYVDGLMVQELKSERFRISSKASSVTDVVAFSDSGDGGFSPRSHVYAPGHTLITVKASSVIPRRPPLHFIKDKATASNYIELAARHNTRITCYANVTEPGEYFLTVGYSNGSPRSAIRTLGINDRDVATLLCPPMQANDWITVHPSNTVTVSLNEGSNKISLTYRGGTMLLNKITLLKKNN